MIWPTVAVGRVLEVKTFSLLYSPSNLLACSWSLVNLHLSVSCIDQNQNIRFGSEGLSKLDMRFQLEQKVRQNMGRYIVARLQYTFQQATKLESLKVSF